MRKFIKTLIATITLAVLIMPAVGLAASASQKAVCGGAGLGAACAAPAGANVQSVTTKAVQLFAVVIGLVGVIMVMIAGLKYMTSNGDAGAVASAKNTLIYAVIGLFVAALAQGIVKYVLNKAQ